MSTLVDVVAGTDLRRVRQRVDRRLSALGDGVQVQIGRLVGQWVANHARLGDAQRVDESS